MARNQSSFVEVFACHPSNVVVLLTTYARNGRTDKWVWHGFCALQPEAEARLKSLAKLDGMEIYIHSHYREYLVDWKDAAPGFRCACCSEEIQYLPIGYHLTPA